jgi:MOSC domain-containing protein YiiM
MTGTVTAIFICPTGAAAMTAVGEATLVLDEGIAGDRYALGTGTFSKMGVHKPDAEITLIEAEEIERFNASEDLALALGAPRRNIVTRGIRLNDLVGRRFSVGATLLEGLRLCEPCAHLAELVHPQIVAGLVHRAGLRARIVAGGKIKAGDAVTPDLAAVTPVTQRCDR